MADVVLRTLFTGIAFFIYLALCTSVDGALRRTRAFYHGLK